MAAGAFAQTTVEFPIPTPSSETVSITQGPDGNLWFTESQGNKVGRITPSGTITEFPVPTPAAYPGRITLGADGNLWFTENLVGKIGRITPAGVITEYQLAADAAPSGIVAGPDGNVWFTESSPRRIGRITPSGAITEFPLSTTSGWPGEITVGPDGNLWFTEIGFYSGIGRFTPAGAYVRFPVPGNPTSITSGPDGALWYGIIALYDIGRITTTGSITEFTAPPTLASPEGIVTGPDGNLWFTQSQPIITRVTTAGVSMQCAMPHGGRQLTIGPDGNLWVAGFSQIARFTLPAGNCPPLPPPPPPPSPTFAISPAHPTTTDVVHITIDTRRICYPVSPTDGVSVATNGNVIQILASVTCPGLIGVPPPPYGFTVDIGPLPAGSYDVQFSMRTATAPGVYGAPQLLSSASFQVDGVGEPIPVLSPAAIGALAILLGVVALAALREPST